MKSKLLDSAFSLFDTFKKNKLKNNSSETEWQASNSLLQNKDIIIQKAEKGNTIVVIDKDVYKNNMKATTSNRSKFENLDIQEENYLNFILNKTKGLRKLLNPCMKKFVLLNVNI